MKDLSECRVLIVDDVKANVAILVEALRDDYKLSVALDGKTALAYSRVRRQDDDYHRMDRQRCVLEAVASEADPFRLLRLLPVIAPRPGCGTACTELAA